ncbi:MAG: iron ABC transporter permease [Chloroflexi bacterium]|nr:iron ABC transporter permease [Chloroflexota bacterium]
MSRTCEDRRRHAARPRPAGIASTAPRTRRGVFVTRESFGASVREAAAILPSGTTTFLRLPTPGPALAGVTLLVVVALVALTQGAADIPPATVVRILLDSLPLVSVDVTVPVTQETIVLDIRLPRVIAAGAVGAALALSGASYQGVFRNPLAGPFLLGVASGAALGAAIAIISPLSADAYGFGWVPVFAFAGALGTVVLVYLLATGGGGVDSTTLILAGVALSAVFGAATAFILLTGGEQARPIFSFLFGGFNTSNWERIAWAAPYMLVGTVLVAMHARVLNVLQLDEEQAAQLGVSVTRTKLIVLAAASLTAATAVAMAGVIGFVGLIVPHAVRLAFGGDHRRLLPLAALFGASFLILVDLLARTMLSPQEVPVGVLTALLGGPFFLWLLRTRRAAAL